MEIEYQVSSIGKLVYLLVINFGVYYLKDFIFGFFINYD